METASVYATVIDRTIEKITSSPEASGLRKDVIETIRRKWQSGIEKGIAQPGSTIQSVKDSNPSAVIRAKYRVDAPPDTTAAQSSTKTPIELDLEEDFADEFEDAEFVHATEVGRKLAESAIVNVTAVSSVPQAPARQLVTPVKKEMVNVEPLEDSLDDPEYDQILEPGQCQVRVFGQTEVCESIQGPRRSDSRWMVTVLNGFIKTKDGDEYLFRTANQTMPHFHQHL